MGGGNGGNMGKMQVFQPGAAGLLEGDDVQLQRMGKRLVRAAARELEAMFAEFCEARQIVRITTDGGLETTTGRRCEYPGQVPGMPGFPGLDMPGCPVNVDACAFPALDTDIRLFSWPEIEAQMWDTDTAINQILVGALPLAAGASILFEQELRRTITWIPENVMITTTWTGTPQPALLQYQWSSGPKGAIAGRVNFSNPQRGNQYEGGAVPNTSTTPIRQKFPTYRGVDSIPIGALSSLSLLVTLDAIATSTLEAIDIRVYHKKSRRCECDGCRAGVKCCAE